MDPDLLKQIKILVRLAILVMGLLALYLLFIYLLPWVGKVLSVLPVLFLPFILAAILAVLIEPVVSRLEKHLHLNRGIAVFFSLVMVVGALCLVLFLLVSEIIHEMSRLYPLVSSYSGHISSRVVEAVSQFKLFYIQLNLPPSIQSSLQGNLDKALVLLQGALNGAINIMVQLFAILPSAAVFLLISTVGTFFIVKDRALLRRFFLTVLPAQARSQTRNIISELFKALVGFVRAYSTLISITAVLSMVGLRLMGSEYALTIGILAGILDILPILGPATIFIPWIIWEFAVGNTQFAVGLLVLYVIISVVRQFLEPKIVGDNLGLHPLATMVSLYVGLQLGGVAGMVLGPVLVVIFMACYRVGLFDRFKWRNNK